MIFFLKVDFYLKDGDVKLGAPVEKRILNGMTLKDNFDSEGDVCIADCQDGYGVKSYKKLIFIKWETLKRENWKEQVVFSIEKFTSEENSKKENNKYFGYLDISNLPKD